MEYVGYIFLWISGFLIGWDLASRRSEKNWFDKIYEDIMKDNQYDRKAEVE